LSNREHVYVIQRITVLEHIVSVALTSETYNLLNDRVLSILFLSYNYSTSMLNT